MALKLRIRPQFPANILVENPILLTKEGSTYTFSFDADNAPTGPQGDPGPTGAAGAGYGGTSTTSLLIANSVTKTFVTQTNLAYQVGNYVRASSQANGSNYMEGTVASYGGGPNLAIAVTAIGGAGTFADWSFSIAGSPGSVGVALIAGNSGNFTLEGGLTNDVNKLVMQQMLPGGRLTLTSATPVTTTDVTAATVVYYAPTIHPWVPIYNGTQMRLYQFTSSATDAVGLSVTLGANWTLNTNYDWFAINDSGTLRLGSGPSWNAGAVAGSDTARGTGAASTELQMYNGVWTNKNTITIRYANASTVSVPANQATYVGSFRTVAAGQAEDSMAKRFLYNAYNQTQRVLKGATETATSWTYTSTTMRQANANAANQLDVLVGLAGNAVSAQVFCFSDTSAGGSFPNVGIGIDSTTVNSAQFWMASPSTNRGFATAKYDGYLAIGRHAMPWLEWAGVAAGTNTYYGQQTTNSQYQSGISGLVLM